MRGTLSALALVALVGCDDSDECAQLQALRARARSVLANAEAKAKLGPDFAKRRDERKARSEEVLRQLELDRPEDELTAILEERGGAYPGVSFERTTREDNSRASGDAVGGRSTVWVFDIARRKLSDIFPLIEELSMSPPLTLVSAVTRTDDGWRLELKRATVPRVPIQGEPIPLPEVPDPSIVPDQPGFCGDDALRAEIREKIEAIEAIRERAEAATVALPESASYRGLIGRAEALSKLERGARIVVAAVLQAASKKRVGLLSVFVEDDNILVEVEGGAKAVNELQTGLPAEIAALVREIPATQGAREGRIVIPNPVAQQLGPRNEKEDEESEVLNSLGLPSPSQLEKELRKEFGLEAHDHDHDHGHAH